MMNTEKVNCVQSERTGHQMPSPFGIDLPLLNTSDKFLFQPKSYG